MSERGQFDARDASCKSQGSTVVLLVVLVSVFTSANDLPWTKWTDDQSSGEVVPSLTVLWILFWHRPLESSSIKVHQSIFDPSVQ